MIINTARLLLPVICALLIVDTLEAQNLSFSSPIAYLPEARTDRAIDITNFKGNFFAVWKDAGAGGNVYISHLGRQYGSFDPRVHAVEGARTQSAPVLRVLKDRMYVFWIAPEGTLMYCINSADSGLAVGAARAVDFGNTTVVDLGITAAAFGDKMILATHKRDKVGLVYSVLEPDSDGVLKKAALLDIPAGRSVDYPFVAALSDSVARFTWRGSKDEAVWYSDFHASTGAWSAPGRLAKTGSSMSPAIYRVFNSDRLFYIWPATGRDHRLRYAATASSATPADDEQLPDYFASRFAVSICNVDQSKFILSFIGLDGKFYLSFFTNYNPGHWMEDILTPGKRLYTLKDIVIPGAHDAGMSVLTAVGGQQSGSINECNTLTQTQGIGSQLNAGIRMFDLRIGRYNRQLYSKHSSADCMADAMGGGYGESLYSILTSIKRFLATNKKEIVLLSFSHFCEQEAGAGEVADSIIKVLGTGVLYEHKGKGLGEISLAELAGKVIVTFEHFARPDLGIDSCSIAQSSNCFINFRREYAATNKLANLLKKQETFFQQMQKTGANDLVRLDWQLTQSSDEAAMVCNDFQNEKMSPIINGAMLLTNVIRKHQSVIDLSLDGNKNLPGWINKRLSNGTFTSFNKPNILYVDVAGAWITDYCIELNNKQLYTSGKAN